MDYSAIKPNKTRQRSSERDNAVHEKQRHKRCHENQNATQRKRDDTLFFTNCIVARRHRRKQTQTRRQLGLYVPRSAKGIQRLQRRTKLCVLKLYTTIHTRSYLALRRPFWSIVCFGHTVFNPPIKTLFEEVEALSSRRLTTI